VSKEIIRVKVKPNARVSRLERVDDGTWLAQVKSPPVDGKANEELLALVAAHFSRRRSQVTLKSGGSGRMKRIEIDEA
jgi:uncharacterized protein (TIGR00251 family)